MMASENTLFLIEMARAAHGNICPPAGHDTFETAITEHFGRTYLWYNAVATNSTHVVSIPVCREVIAA